MIPAKPAYMVVESLRAAGCVFAEEEALLLVEAAAAGGDLQAMLEQRVSGIPLEHVVGWAEFCDLRILVDPGVFVPRVRSEFLAQQAIERTGWGSVVVDLCCGAGALGVAIAAAVPSIELHATDIDERAVACARRNVEPIGGRIYAGDLDAGLPDGLRGGVDVLVCNAPYVPTGDIELLPREARLHEPDIALDGGSDGTQVQGRAAAIAPAWLAPDGWFLVETSERQVPATVRAVEAAGLLATVVRDEELDATVVLGAMPAAASGDRD